MDKENFFLQFVERWDEADCLQFLKDENNLDRLRDYCLQSMESDFTDCETVDEIKEVAHSSWLEQLYARGN